jgi:exopolysaccharide biosynthesis polyprenyl glycosylphosphotransferase
VSTLPDLQNDSGAVVVTRPVGRISERPELAWVTLRLVVDVAMLALSSALVALVARLEDASAPPVTWLAVYPVVVLVLFRIRGMYAQRVRLQVLDDLRGVVSATALAAMVVVTIRALVGEDALLAGQTIGQWVASAALLSTGRVGTALLLRQNWRHDQWVRPTLIVGAGHVGQLVARRLLEQPDSGHRPIGFLDKEPLDEVGESGLPVLGASWDLERTVQEFGVRHVIVTFSTAPHQVLLGIVDRCDRLGVSVSLVPRLYEKVTRRLAVEHLGGLPLLTMERLDPKGWQFELKYAADRVVAAFGLLVASPFIALGAISIRLSLGSPVLFRQQRVGLDGKTFELVKFRSMRPPAAGASASPDAPSDEADRLTRVGSFVRAASIDELPQLWNVLKGDMSLIGPRPERPEFCEIFEDYVYRYGDRHRVKSGITGWAQVHGIGRGEARFSPEALRDRVEWDNYYIENWSLWLDLKIVLMTVAAVFSFRQT